MKLAKIGLGVLALSFAITSHASHPPTLLIDGNPDVFPVTDTFTGPATLTKVCGFVPINLNCTFGVTGTISDNGTDTTSLTITDATSTNGPLCGNVDFLDFPWEGSVDHSDLPTAADPSRLVPFNIEGIRVGTTCGYCAGSLTATYTNEDGGTFAFAGSLPFDGGSIFPGPCNVASPALSSADHTYYIEH